MLGGDKKGKKQRRRKLESGCLVIDFATHSVSKAAFSTCLDTWYMDHIPLFVCERMDERDGVCAGKRGTCWHVVRGCH